MAKGSCAAPSAAVAAWRLVVVAAAVAVAPGAALGLIRASGTLYARHGQQRSGALAGEGQALALEQQSYVAVATAAAAATAEIAGMSNVAIEVPRRGDQPQVIRTSFTKLGSGHCAAGYYAGWVSAEAVDASTCAAKCSSEPQCRFFFLIPGSSCSRYNESAGDCLERPTRPTDKADAVSYRREMQNLGNLNGTFNEWQAWSELIAVPSQNLIFCALPKSACTQWKQLMLRANGVPHWNTTDGRQIHDPVLSGLTLVGVAYGKQSRDPEGQSMQEISDIFNAKVPWTKAVMVRDPVTRLLSTFLDRCVDMGEWRRCKSSTGPIPFAEAVANIEAEPDITDVHFRRQVDMCGLKYAKYDIIGRQERFLEDSRYILDKTGLWERFGSSGWGKYGNASFGAEEQATSNHAEEHNTAEKVCRFYNAELLERVHRLYEEDFVKFGYNVSYWAEKCKEVWRLRDAPVPLTEAWLRSDLRLATLQDGKAADALALPRLAVRPLTKVEECRGSLHPAATSPASPSAPPSAAAPPASALGAAAAASAAAASGTAATEDPSSACRPSWGEITAMQRPQPDRHVTLPQFFLHEGPALAAFDESVRCFMSSAGVDPLTLDFDDRLRPFVAEHMTELWLLRRLRGHAQRTKNQTQARVHIIGAPVFTSRLAGLRGCDSDEDLRDGAGSGHERRMRNLRHELEAVRGFQSSKGRDYFIVMTHSDVERDFTPYFMDLLNQGGIVVGTGDPHYGAWDKYRGVRKIVLPYKAHYLTESEAWRGANRLERPRELSVMFHGRSESASESHKGLRTITAGLENASVRLEKFQSMKTEEAVAMTAENALAMRHSRFCLVHGDYPSTRQLFDALAVGCVPVVLGNFSQVMTALPFPNTVDWPRVALFAGSLGCAVEHAEGIGLWLQKLMARVGHHNWDEACVREHGGYQFLNSLSYMYGAGLVDAILRELLLGGFLPSAASVAAAAAVP